MGGVRARAGGMVRVLVVVQQRRVRAVVPQVDRGRVSAVHTARAKRWLLRACHGVRTIVADRSGRRGLLRRRGRPRRVHLVDVALELVQIREIDAAAVVVGQTPKAQVRLLVPGQGARQQRGRKGRALREPAAVAAPAAEHASLDATHASPTTTSSSCCSS